LRVQRFASVREELVKGDVLPPALLDLRTKFSFAWAREHEHQNVKGPQGWPATVVYMGEAAVDREVDAVGKTLSELLRLASEEVDGRPSARDRLLVMFRDTGGVRAWQPERGVRIGDPRDTSEFDISREA